LAEHASAPSEFGGPGAQPTSCPSSRCASLRRYAVVCRWLPHQRGGAPAERPEQTLRGAADQVWRPWRRAVGGRSARRPLASSWRSPSTPSSSRPNSDGCRDPRPRRISPSAEFGFPVRRCYSPGCSLSRSCAAGRANLGKDERSGRRDSNPRHPAWKACSRIRIQIAGEVAFERTDSDSCSRAKPDGFAPKRRVLRTGPRRQAGKNGVGGNGTPGARGRGLSLDQGAASASPQADAPQRPAASASPRAHQSAHRLPVDSGGTSDCW
jgi:hypothetical protein